MRTEEANHIKDKMNSISLNYSKANFVESVMRINRDKFKVKERRIRN